MFCDRVPVYSLLLKSSYASLRVSSIHFCLGLPTRRSAAVSGSNSLFAKVTCFIGSLSSVLMMCPRSERCLLFCVCVTLLICRLSNRGNATPTSLFALYYTL